MQSVGQGKNAPLMGGLCGFEPLTEVKKGKKKRKGEVERSYMDIKLQES